MGELTDVATNYYKRKLELGMNLADIVEAIEATCEVLTVSLPLMDEKQQTTSRLLVDTLTDVNSKIASTFRGNLLAAQLVREREDLPHPPD